MVVKMNFQAIIKFFKNPFSQTMFSKNADIQDGVRKTIVQYEDTLITLEKYDKGEIKHDDSTRRSSLRDYLQRIQSESHEVSRDNGGTFTSI